MGNDTHAIITLLQQTTEGQHALGVQQTWHVTVVFGRPGTGTQYRESTNTVVIDPTHPAPDLAFVHEMTHAEYHNRHWAPDPMTMNRANYITARVHEEAEAMANDSLASVALNQGAFATQERPQPVGEAFFVQAAENSPAYQPAYDAAYEQAYNRIVGRGGAVSATVASHIAADEAHIAGLQAGRAAGVQALDNHLMQGTFIGSAHGQTYPQDFARYWNEMHHLVG